MWSSRSPRRGTSPCRRFIPGGVWNPLPDQLAEGKLKVSHFYSQVKIKKIPETSLRQVDPELKSFFNINTPEDMDGLEPSLESKIDHRFW